MFASSPHIQPKALTKETQADRDTARQHIADTIRQHVGVHKSVSTSRLAGALGVSNSYVKLARLADPALPMSGEMRMLEMMGTLPPEFANALLAPYGLQVTRAPGHKPVNWMQVAQICAMFAARLNNDASDGVFCRATELPAQLSEGQALVQTAHAYTASVKAALASGTSIPVACWN
jgi:hypothetical protein